MVALRAEFAHVDVREPDFGSEFDTDCDLEAFDDLDPSLEGPSGGDCYPGDLSGAATAR